MGNCLNSRPPATWLEGDDDGEEWEVEPVEEVVLEKQHSSEAAKVGAAKEVKIKINKKQLEELLRNADLQGLPVHQFLAHLISFAADTELRDGGRPWQPVLQTIPEAAE